MVIGHGASGEHNPITGPCHKLCPAFVSLGSRRWRGRLGVSSPWDADVPGAVRWWGSSTSSSCAPTDVSSLQIPAHRTLPHVRDHHHQWQEPEGPVCGPGRSWGCVCSGTSLFDRLTVLEHLLLFASLKALRGDPPGAA